MECLGTGDESSFGTPLLILCSNYALKTRMLIEGLPMAKTETLSPATVSRSWLPRLDGGTALMAVLIGVMGFMSFTLWC